ncbi:hypothetical protein HGA88_06795 [Candidatus Roizmanbacteria bacterium]|nr:hypothetical protein [Candidatus Roizmanbacteria bacterium]
MAKTKSSPNRLHSPTPLFIGTMAVLLFLFGCVVGIRIGIDLIPTSTIVVESKLPTKADTTSPSKANTSYACPKAEWVNCMPGPGKQKPECASAFLEWATKNCPGFKGAAL